MQEKPQLESIKQCLSELSGELTEIGEGGFKVVFRGSIAGKNEAIKVAFIPSDKDDESVEDESTSRLMREISTLSRCSSPFLVKLGKVTPAKHKIEGKNYIIYSEEFLEGRDLRQFIKEKYKPDISELRVLAKCLLLAVKEMWSMNLVHRDIKPDNIVKTEDPERNFVLLDLGIAFSVGGTRLTRNSLNMPGTLYYLAPEMLAPKFRDNFDYRADLYTIGLTLYEYASGIQPFAKQCDGNPYTTLYRIKNVKPDRLKVLRKDLPIEFCDLVDQLIKKRPALRPANIDALLREMEG